MGEVDDYYTRYRRTFDSVGYVCGVDGPPQLIYLEPKEFNGLAGIVGDKPIPIFFYQNKSKQGGPPVVVLFPLSTLETTVSGNGNNLDEAKRQLIPKLKEHPGLIFAHMGFFNNPENYLQFAKNSPEK